MHGQETRVLGDQAYRGQRVVIREPASGRVPRPWRLSPTFPVRPVRWLPVVRPPRPYPVSSTNTHRLLVTCALANLFMARRHLLRCHGA